MVKKMNTEQLFLDKWRNDVNLKGKLDPVILDYTRETNRILLTQNCQDFDDLHNLNPNHPGILAIYLL